jgi:hypothetical protein
LEELKGQESNRQVAAAALTRSKAQACTELLLYQGPQLLAALREATTLLLQLLDGCCMPQDLNTAPGAGFTRAAEGKGVGMGGEPGMAGLGGGGQGGPGSLAGLQRRNLRQLQQLALAQEEAVAGGSPRGDGKLRRY